MIIKDIDKKKNLKKHQLYGYNAEKQMAFYLKRAFQDKEDIFVINDLRLEMNGNVAQIDHLIVHPFGFIIIESKSITSNISVNELEEWARHHPNPKYTKGIPSPVNQAKRQADFLKNFLMARSEHLLRKKRFFKSSISDFKFDVLVAISDNGIIHRAKNTDLRKVYKADQIVDTINNLLSGYADTNKLFTLSLKVNSQLADSSMKNITTYLLQSHAPSKDNREKKNIAQNEIQHKEVVAKKPSQNKSTDNTITPQNQAAESSTKKCSQCHSGDIIITYGRYGYYFKCRACEGNTSIKTKCKDCSYKSKIRKNRDHFYKDCEYCKTSELYFINQPIN